jgi:hypothetical protein
MENNFTENFYLGEEEILDVFMLYFGKNKRFYLYQHTNKTIEIKLIQLKLEFLETNLKNNFLLLDIDKEEDKLQIFFSTFLEKINKYYLD